jgi:hypothetical protein
MSLFQDVDTVQATIAAGAALSAQVNLGKKTLVAIVMPAAWTAADLTFQSSPNGGASFGELYYADGVSTDAAAEMQIHAPAAGQFIVLDPTKWRGVNCLTVRSGTSAAPVNQVAQAVLTLVIRGIA